MLVHFAFFPIMHPSLVLKKGFPPFNNSNLQSRSRTVSSGTTWPGCYRSTPMAFLLPPVVTHIPGVQCIAAPPLIPHPKGLEAGKLNLRL